MDSLEQDYGTALFESATPPCISLYQPTHRHHPDNAQDPIRFRNLVRSLEESLRRQYGKADVEALLQPFSSLARDAEFWNHTLDGLAVLAASSLFRVYRLQRSVPELAIAADSFHLKPLRRVMQSADRFQILALSRDEIRLFEGNRDVLDEIEPADGVPRTLVEALGAEVTEPHLTVSSYGGGPGGPGMHHGHGARKDEVSIDAERFFRAVDRAVLEHHSRPSDLPLLLLGVAENQSVFRRVSRNKLLVEEGIDMGPKALSTDDARERAWRILEPRYVGQLRGFVDQFNEAHGKGLASDDLDQVVSAACTGRVATLLVDADCEIAGRIDVAAGRAIRDELANPDIDDVLDDLGAIVANGGGEWIIVPRERMPTQTGLAAIYRY
jgi:hypothetical protein